jgi:hypothetical protein
MADLTPDQGGGPTWGTLAIPSAMSAFSPGAAIIGGLATDTALNAKRAQNLAAFDAYQKMNPGANAADLSGAAEHIFGGNNWLTGDLGAPGVMQSIAEKNQLALRADQSKQQATVDAGYQDAMDTAIATADSPEDWVAKTKSLLAPSAASTFDTYMAPKDSATMFRVYQQKRVKPLVDTGIASMWDTPDEYTIAAGGNAALGKMAYDMAKPSVDAKKQEIADKHGLIGAQIGHEQAGTAAEYATVQAERARTQQENVTTQSLVADANVKRLQFLNEQLNDPIVANGISSQDPANLAQANKLLEDRYHAAFGTGHDDELTSWKATAPAVVAGQTAAKLNAQAQQTGALTFQQEVVAPTLGMKAQIAPDNTSAYGGLDQTAFDKLDKDAKTAMQAQTLSNTRALLADKDVVVTDTAAFKRIVAEGTIAGKNPTQIQHDLENTLSPENGLPIYGNSALIQDKVVNNTPGAGISPTSAPELQQQVSEVTRSTIISGDGLLNLLTKGKGAVPGTNVPAAVQAYKEQYARATNQINTAIATIQNRNTTGVVYGKDKTTLAFLLNQRAALEDKGAEVNSILTKRPDLKVAAATSPGVAVGSKQIDINTDMSTVNDAMTSGVISQVNDVANHPAPSRLGRSPQMNLLDQRLPQYLQSNPEAAKLAAATIREADRVRALGTTVGVPSLKMGSFTRNAPPPAPTQLNRPQIVEIVRQMIAANAMGGDWGQEDRAFMQDQLTKLILSQQQ